MTVPGFVEFDPAGGCPCGGCAQERRVLQHALAVRDGGHPGAHGARRALVLMATAGTVLSSGVSGPGAAVALAAGAGTGTPGGSGRALLAPAAGHGTGLTKAPGPAAGPDLSMTSGATPQGQVGGLFGGTGSGRGLVTAASATRSLTREQIIARAQRWISAQVPYDMNRYWSDGYRQDCSGFISMAWNLGRNQWTGSLAQFGIRITKSELRPGDMLLFHNPANPGAGSHATIFGGWTDSSRTRYVAYEQTRPHTVKRPTPYAYWSNSTRYVAYRYRGLADGGDPGDGTGDTSAFPGAGKFGPGADNAYVTRLGRMLVERGGGRFYTSGPGPRWSEADRRATAAFQRAQGWSGAAADGIPGPSTWSYLVNGTGRDIGGGTSGGGGATAFPGTGWFRPGQSNGYVTSLGKRLVSKGFGKHYTSGPGPRWTEADRRNVEAFQRAQGWTGRDADGYPGPETWRRLFR
ncbi:peptidoglycan-binding protein [Streptomyces sp. NPDC059788]|uniref:peptidoglycan-binding protein n=1 Tax=Streptomyces sp. NPDC059788 TaxID=3346948 RepID=UPI003669F0FD